MSRPASIVRWVVPALALACRPRLWSVALQQAWRLAPSGWWRQWPPSPWPARSYLDFRLQTAYGTPGATPPASDLIAYLEWCRRMRGLSG